MMQFDVGDKAVYPTQGVAEVIGIEEKEISGKVMRFYSLRLLDTGLKILVPVDKAEQVGLREVVGEPQIKEVYSILKEKDVPIDKQTWNRRYRGFMEKLKTGSLYEVAEVYRDLSRLKLTKTLSFGERKMLDTARNLIVKELSVAKRTTEVKVEQEIERILSM
jgi:CarD family transcriptional regulator